MTRVLIYVTDSLAELLALGVGSSSLAGVLGCAVLELDPRFDT